MNKFFHFLIGLILFLGALACDVVFLAVVWFLIKDGVKLPEVIFFGVCFYLWFRGQHSGAFGNAKIHPFESWKPSVMKSFWKNWMACRS